MHAKAATKYYVSLVLKLKTIQMPLKRTVLKPRLVQQILLMILLASQSGTICAQTSKTSIVAHRGAWIPNQIPQNSIEAIKKAAEYGCEGAEFDVQITSDGKLIVNHDAEHKGMQVNTHTYAQLAEQPLANGERLPTLESYLIEGLKLEHLTLFVELKSAATGLETTLLSVRKCLELVKKVGAQDRVEYLLFSREAARYLLSLQPNAKVSYLNGDLSPQQAKEDGFAGLDYHYSVFQKNENWIAEARKLGLSLNAWTVNDPAVIDWLLDKEFDYLTTDIPLVVKEHIQQRLKK